MTVVFLIYNICRYVVDLLLISYTNYNEKLIIKICFLEIIQIKYNYVNK